MTLAEELGAFAARIGPGDLGPPAREALAAHLLDAVGCALAAVGEPGPARLLAHLGAGGCAGPATAIGGGRLPPDRAALANAALVAWLDRHDAFLAPDASIHPAETVGAVLAAAEEADGDGGQLLAGLAVAYELAVRLAREAPVRARGFDPATHLAVAAAGGAARALGLDAERAAHAIALAAVRAPVLGVAGGRLAGPLSVRDGLDAALLARSGISGPLDAFEGRRGTFEVLTGPFHPGELTGPGTGAVTAVAFRFHPGDVRAQPAIEAAHDVAGRRAYAPERVDRIEVRVPPLHARLLAPGEPSRNLPHLVATALADVPSQRDRLRQRVDIHADPALARELPAVGPAAIRVRLGRTVLEAFRRDAEGSPTRPVPFDRVEDAFGRLAARVPPATRRALAAAIRSLPAGSVRELAALLASASAGPHFR